MTTLASHFGRLSRASATLLTLALFGCSTGQVQWEGPDEKGFVEADSSRQGDIPAAITVSDPQIYSRESLVNDRRAEQEYLSDLLTASTTIEFPPQIERDVSVIRSLAASLGLAFDPASEIEYERALEADEADRSWHQIELERRLQALEQADTLNQRKLDVVLQRLELELELLKAQVAAVRETGTLPEGVEAPTPTVYEPTADGANYEGVTLPAAPIAAPPDLTALDTAITSLLGKLDSEAVREAEIDAGPEELFDDRNAYRQRLRSALAQARLDDAHDQGGNALYRLQFQLTKAPGARKSKYGVAHFELQTPTIIHEEAMSLYKAWVGQVSYRLMQARNQADARSTRFADPTLDLLSSAFRLYSIATISFHPEKPRLWRLAPCPLSAGKDACQEVSIAIPSDSQIAEDLLFLENYRPWYHQLKTETLMRRLRKPPLESDMQLERSTGDAQPAGNAVPTVPPSNACALSSPPCVMHPPPTAGSMQVDGASTACLSTFQDERADAVWGEPLPALFGCLRHFETTLSPSIDIVVDNKDALECQKSFDQKKHAEVGLKLVDGARTTTTGWKACDRLLSANSGLGTQALLTREELRVWLHAQRRAKKELTHCTGLLQHQTASNLGTLEQLTVDQLIDWSRTLLEEVGPIERQATLDYALANLRVQIQLSSSLQAYFVRARTNPQLSQRLAGFAAALTEDARHSLQLVDSLYTRNNCTTPPSAEDVYLHPFHWYTEDSGLKLPWGFCAAIARGREDLEKCRDEGPFQLRGEGAAYAVAPFEVAQNVSTVSSAQSALQLALGLKADLAAQGAGAQAALGYGKAARVRTNQLERFPVVVAYSEFPQAHEPPGHGRFGWVLGPKLVFDQESNGFELEQNLDPYVGFVDLVIPGWWPKVVMDVRTVWVGNWYDDSLLRDGSRKSLAKRIKTDRASLDDLTTRISEHFLGTRVQRASIYGVTPKTLSICRGKTTLLIEGSDLWRSQEVYLDGVAAESGSVRVLPDMEGISATFDMSKLRVRSKSNPKGKLSVWTGHGYDEVDLDLTGAVKDGTCTDAPPTAKSESPALAKLSPGTISRCVDSTDFVLAVKNVPQKPKKKDEGAEKKNDEKSESANKDNEKQDDTWLEADAFLAGLKAEDDPVKGSVSVCKKEKCTVLFKATFTELKQHLRGLEKATVTITSPHLGVLTGEVVVKGDCDGDTVVDGRAFDVITRNEAGFDACRSGDTLTVVGRGLGDLESAEFLGVESKLIEKAGENVAVVRFKDTPFFDTEEAVATSATLRLKLNGKKRSKAVPLTCSPAPCRPPACAG